MATRPIRGAVWRRGAAPDQLLLVDGSVRHLPHLPANVVGVVMTTDRILDADSESLRHRRPGWRSRAFEMLRDVTGEQPVRSAYVRLHEAYSSSSFGLVRIEVRDRGLLDVAAAACFEHRQAQP